MKPVGRVQFTQNGLKGNVACQPLRHVLISSLPIARECGLVPGDLRENIVVDDLHLYELESGTVVVIGEARIRLTFHCEPCKGILAKVKLRDILHKRGVLGCFLNSGEIYVGDGYSVKRQQFDPIPYEIKDRIKWYVARQNVPVAADKLVYEIGLSKSYLRALPALIRRTPGLDPASITFKSQQRTVEPVHSRR
jgi:MOSC domain-containing protein YiiM